MNWDFVREIAIGLSAIVATLTFILKVQGDSRARRKSEVLSWQSTVIHALFQNPQTDSLKFEDVLQRYRTEAFAFPKHTIKKDELTEDALREILIALVKSGCVLQLGEDKYKLKKDREFGTELAPIMANALQSFAANPPQLQQMLTQQLIVTDQIVNLISENPARYTMSDVILKVSSNNQIPQERTTSIIRRLINSGLLEEGADGRFNLGRSRDLGDLLGPT